jgi:endonuclease/exonuclease/phosphatase family metal-dependent hydrolase
MVFSLFKKKKKSNLHTIAFYNLENLFGTIDDPNTMDDDFTPKGFKKWTPKRYKKKVFKLAKTISEIGVDSTERPPVLVGIAEVENEKAIQDLINAESLRKTAYHYVHYDSPDERGIDTGLLYHKDYFEVLFSEPIALMVYNVEGERDTTRDILYVHGKLNGEEVHVFVNHWPSRRAGDKETDYKRVEAAKTIKLKMAQIEEQYVNPNYIIMGDFNDNPDSNSIQLLVKDSNLYNPMEKLRSPERGSANYRRSWSMFDQILVSHNFFNYEKGTHSFAHANIFDDILLTQWKGKYKGTPFRTYAGRKYIGGYSDHFPVYIQLKYNG